MGRFDRNLYRIDDVLLRSGGIGLLLVLGAGFCAVVVALADAEPHGPDPVVTLLGAYGLIFFGALLCPVAALWAGLAIRRREKRSAAFWKLLQQNAELSVRDLIANSDFSLEDVERTVKLLNNRGLGHYVWDRSAGTVQDGRLRTIQLHVDKCEVCGGSVSLEVPIGFTEVPVCPYCGDPVSVDTLEARRHEALEELRINDRPIVWESGSKVPFSIPIFLVLMLTFWPAGVAYAWYRCQNAD